MASYEGSPVSPPAVRPVLLTPPNVIRTPGYPDMTPNCPRRQRELNEFGYESNFDIVVKLQCPKPPCDQVEVRLESPFTISTGQILKDACAQFKLSPDKYDLYYNTYNLTETKLRMIYTSESVCAIVHDPNFRYRPGMEFTLVGRPAGGVMGCFGGVCARPYKGGTRGRGQKFSKRAKRQTRRRSY
jgi:hypothetical protein